MYLYLNLTLKPPALVLVVHYLLLHVFIEKLILRHFPLWAPTIFKHIIIQSFFHWKHLYISICVQQYSIRGHSTYAVWHHFIWQSADLFKNTDAPVQGHLRCQVWASLWFSPPGLRPVTETNPLMTQRVRTEHLTAELHFLDRFSCLGCGNIHQWHQKWKIAARQDKPPWSTVSRVAPMQWRHRSGRSSVCFSYTKGYAVGSVMAASQILLGHFVQIWSFHKRWSWNCRHSGIETGCLMSWSER